MDDETKEDSQPERDSWLNDPFTRVMLERVKTQSVPDLLTALLRACDKSNDPTVRYWYARYVSGLAVEDFLTKGELNT